MVGRLLAKVGVASSTITGVVYLDVLPKNYVVAKSKEDNEQATEELNTIEDIELFERKHGCNFIFVNSWDKKEFYSARGFYEQKTKEEGEAWKKAMVEVLKAPDKDKKTAKNYCKDQKGAITLFDDQDKKTFRLGEPQRGWNS